VPAIVALSREEYHATMIHPMRRHLDTIDEVRLVNLAPYVAEYVRDLCFPNTMDDIELQRVYLNGNNTFFHVLLFFGEPNVYLVVVVDCSREAVHGHYLLDLNEEYGLNEVPEV
jgi:hypothetical protein